MDDAINYANSLRSALNSQSQDFSKSITANERIEEFNQRLQEGLTPFTTEFLREGLGPIVKKVGVSVAKKLGIKGGEQLAKDAVDKGVPKALSNYLQRSFRPNQSVPEAEEAVNSEPISGARSVTFNNPVFDPDQEIETENTLQEGADNVEEATGQTEAEASQVANSVTDAAAGAEEAPSTTFKFGDVLNNTDLYKRWVNKLEPGLLDGRNEEEIEQSRHILLSKNPKMDANVEVGPENEPVAQPGTTSNRIGRLLNQSQQESAPTAEELGQEAEQSGENAIVSGGENAAEDVADTAGSILSKAASKAAPLAEELAPEVALDSDPFTAPIGILLGIGTLLGELFGQKSHPAVPKIIQTPTQVSSQFGI